VDNANYMAQRDWGYDPEGILSIPVSNKSEYDNLKKAAVEHPNVIAVTGAQQHIGVNVSYTTISDIDTDHKSYVYKVGPDYAEIMDLRMKEGNYFDSDRVSDLSNRAYINESFANTLGWTEPIGKTFTYDSIRYNVIGVLENFHFFHFYVDIDPVFMISSSDDNYKNLIVKSKSENLAAIDDYLRTAWLDISPNDPYDKSYIEDALDSFYQENNANIVIISFIAGMAVILACLGLFGLISFNINRKLKEFSVRKVLGAPSLDIVKVASREYIWILIGSFAIGAPAGFFMISQLIQSIYPDPKATSVLPFIVAVIIVIVTIGMTISGQIIRALKVNPSENLRAE
ncbi:MAG: ABC transporter permease, partial [Bacteroidota bacterium]